MNIEQLKKYDKELEEEIENISIMYGLKNDSVWPIPDGIYSSEKYAKAMIHLMWILKEPYDDFIDGKPYGGGWSITKNLFDNPTLYAQSSKTGKMVVYTTFGILNNKKWNDIDYFENDPSVAESIKNIAYINLNKMPSGKKTNMAELNKKLKIWRPTVLKQIQYYDPEILIFGNTFPLLKKELFKENVPYKDYNGYVHAYDYGGKLYLWAYHPGANIKQEMYANSIIQAVEDWKSNIKS